MTTTSDIPPAAPTGDAGAPRPPRLERSKDDRVIAGVCGGLGRYFDIDPVIFRVVFGVSAFFGPGLVLYAAGWLFLPEAGLDRTIAQSVGRDGRGWRQYVPRALAVLLILLVVDGIFDGGPWGNGGGFVIGGFLTTVLVVGAVIWLVNGGRPPGLPPTPPWPPMPPLPPMPPAPPGSPGSPGSPSAPLDRSTPATTATATTSTDLLDPPPAMDSPDAPVPPSPSTWWSGSASTPPTTPYAVPDRRPAASERPRLGGLTLSVLLLAAGIAAFLDIIHVVDLTPQGVLAGGLVLIGAALVVGAWYGRARGMVPLGVFTVLLLMLVSAVNIPVRGGFGERIWRPTAQAELTSYELVAGEATLDLTGLPLGEVEQRVKANVGMGQLIVLVPAGARVDVDGHVAFGHLVVFGEERGGADVDDDYAPESADIDLRLEIEVGMGEAVVRRASS